MGQRVHDAHVARHFGRSDQAGKNKVFLQAKRTRAVFQPPAPRAVTHEKEFGAGTLPDEVWGDVQQVVMSFELEKAGDHANDEIVGREAETGAPDRVVLSVEKRLEGESAEDAGVLAGLAEAGGEVLAGHGLRHADVMSGERGGEALGAEKNLVGQGALKRPERGAVNGMDDDRNAGAMGGPAPQNSRLAAVGVDDVRPGGAKNPSQSKQGQEVVEGMDGADQGRDDGKDLRARLEGGEQGTFRPGGGTGQEGHFHAGTLLQAENGGDGVFLGAANDQPGDDVGDPHPRRLQRGSNLWSCWVTLVNSSVLWGANLR